MKWLAAVCMLLYLTRHGDAGAIKCPPTSQDPACASEKSHLLLPSPPSREAECLPGSDWESHCHRCLCTSAGLAQCTKQDSCELPEYKEPIKCKPNTTFTRDCNTCTCLDNGLGLCTLVGCVNWPIPPVKPDEKDRRRRQAPGSGQPQCEAGTSWQEDCNTCRCLNGVPACTRKGCLGNLGPQKAKVQKRETSGPLKTNHVITKRGICKSNLEFQIDCNPCKCAPNGQSYTCTHNECLEGDNNTNKEVEVFMESEGSDHIERHSVCKPRDIFYIGCNPCHCNAYGTDYTCTNKPCPLPKDVEVFHELNVNITKSFNNTKRVICVANRMFIMDCNTCWCNEDGTSFFCTRRVCTPDSTDENSTDEPDFPLEVKLRKVKKECRPNEVFELDCNMCRCSSDGKSFSCTRRACVEIDDKNATGVRKSRAVQQEPPKTCTPGTEFRLDCNKCLCNDEGRDFSCTRIDCTAQNGNTEIEAFSGTRAKREVEQVEMKCTPETVFDRGCNVCRCTSDGLHAVCSLKPCRNLDKEEVTRTTTDPSFRCTPGDQFKQDCKDCTCSADGKNVFCTLRLCDEELNDI